MQALRLLAHHKREGKLYYIQKAVNTRRAELKRGGKAPQITIDEALAQGLLDAKTDADANAAMDAIYNDVKSRTDTAMTLGGPAECMAVFCDAGQPAHAHPKCSVGNIVSSIPDPRHATRSARNAPKWLCGGDPEPAHALPDAEQRGAKGICESGLCGNERRVISGTLILRKCPRCSAGKRYLPKPLQAVMDTANKALDGGSDSQAHDLHQQHGRFSDRARHRPRARGMCRPIF